MSIASEITRINGNIAAAYTALDGKGATLPATQNSANLADTIDTIQTGGVQVVRGGWVVPQCVLDLESAFDNWFNLYTPTLSYVYGVLLYKGITKIKLNSVANTIDTIISSGNNDVYEYESGDIYVTFENIDGDNWVVFQSSLRIDDFNIIAPHDINTTALANGSIRYVIIKNTTSDSTVFSGTDLLSYSSSFRNLESLKCINVKLGNAFIGNDMRGAGRKYIPPITYWQSAIPDNTVVSAFDTYAHTLPNLPYGLDLTSVTTNLTLGTTDGGMNNIKEAYIKLPNADFTITKNSGIVFSRDNWQYIADNAPTVSGKTLTMYGVNIAVCGGSNGQIITTLTNKGWTVN